MTMPSNDTTDAGKRVEAGESGVALVGQVQESVDPFDYAETIVRDLALHVGSRLRDFRSDLAAMHSAVVQLPETMKINALGQSIQELRERLAHLTGVVSQQVSRYPEELDRVGKTAGDLLNRVAGLESWIASARQSMAQGEGPSLPLPTGGFVGQDQMNAIIGQVHESIMRVVGAVRELQLDVRDLRTDMRKVLASPTTELVGEGESVEEVSSEPVARAVPPVATAALVEIDRRLSALEGRPAPVATPSIADPAPALADLSRRLTALENRPSPAAPAAATPAPARADVAALVFGAWNRLAQPAGDASLTQTVEAVLSTLSRRLDQTVRPPAVAKGSGIVAVATAQRGATPVVALLATEDLCGRQWLLGDDGTDMRTSADGDRPAAVRQPCWRALLGAAALAEQQTPGLRVLPILVYGHGAIDKLPSRDDMAAYGQRLGVSAAADRMLIIGASDQSHAGLAQPRDLLQALTDLGL